MSEKFINQLLESGATPDEVAAILERGKTVTDRLIAGEPSEDDE